MFDLIIVGGGPCAVMAAIQAKENKKKVLIIEQNNRLLKKFELTGNGRCNITNNKEIKDFVKMLDNGKAIYNIIKQFPPKEIMNYFTNKGILLKEENDNKIFPVSNKSTDFSKVLVDQLNNVDILLNNKVTKVEKDDNIFTIYTTTNKYEASNLLLATGGKTIKELGNSIENYNLVKSFNHTINPLLVQECPVEVTTPLTELMGIGLKAVNVIVKDNDKVVERLNGDVLFTHFGLSGPAILNCSFSLNKINRNNAKISLQLLNKDYEQTKTLIIDYLKNNPKNYLKSFLNSYLPKKLVIFLLNSINIYDIKNADLNKDQIKQATHLFSNLTFDFKNFYQPQYAFLTGGGVSLKEIDNKNLESKLVSNLFIGGELLDVCGKLGGYNITIALASGYVIGNSIK